MKFFRLTLRCDRYGFQWRIGGVALVMILFGQLALAREPCRIRVIDSENRWPVPLVELRTTHGIRFVSDNAGVIAFDLPELMDEPVWFHIEGHGYNVPKDAFGYRGVRLTPTPGGELTVEVKRELPAKRLGRITGGGLFAESQSFGEHTEWREQSILGCDSVQNVVHRGRIHWAWGDTTLARYPLGLFQSIGATTPIWNRTDWKPPIKLRYEYITDQNGRPRNIAEMPGDGPTWLMGYASLRANDGSDRLVATYSKIKPPLTESEVGLCVWDESQKRFAATKSIWRLDSGKPKPDALPQGHSVLWEDADGIRWILFGDPLPSLRCRATFEAWFDPSSWEPLLPQTTIPSADNRQQIRPHRGSIAWNGYRKKWVTVFTQLGGETSHLGEIWYAESDSPLGPWANAIHVVTHHRYTFYNPQLHPEFVAEDSPELLFEATYTHTFSKTAEPTPRHDYNQVLYRLDLNELH
ncbi:hypothetical protein [Roseiconus lacunae]|uniref:hypothetical protein n=1 Tax=Roseiconus lacunae TaxID=2605694 RepID=UPI00190F8003|nr:hypothetical protein [Roseiconus lacunae]